MVLTINATPNITFLCSCVLIRVIIIHEVNKLNEITLGEFLRDLRNGKGLTTRGLGEEIGFSYSYIASVEKGRRKPSKDFLEKYIYAVSKNNEELTNVKRKISSITDGELYKDFEKKKSIDNEDSMIAAFTNDNDVNTMYVTENNFITDKTYNFPINDISHHLTDKYNTKYFKGINLSDDDRNYINELIKIHLLDKYKNEINILYNQLNSIQHTMKELEKLGVKYVLGDEDSQVYKRINELEHMIMKLEKPNFF